MVWISPQECCTQWFWLHVYTYIPSWTPLSYRVALLYLPKPCRSDHFCIFGRMQCMWCTPVFNCVKKGRTNVCACAGVHLWKQHSVTEITSISQCAVNGVVCVGLWCVVRARTCKENRWSGWLGCLNTCCRSYNAQWASDDFCAQDDYAGEWTIQRDNGGANSRKTLFYKFCKHVMKFVKEVFTCVWQCVVYINF